MKEKLRNKIYHTDCLEGMKEIPDRSIDMILCDLPYAQTASKWDELIPFDKLWEQYERIIKSKGAIVLFASGRFTYQLYQSNPQMFRYKWIWVKSRKGNFVNAKNRPMTQFEEILVFSFATTANGSRNKMNYFPQGLSVYGKEFENSESKFGNIVHKRPSHKKKTVREFTGYPSDILQFSNVTKPIHPTQKPVDLCEYMINTYTHKGDLVLDNCMGSGTTAIACMNTDREFIGFEKEKKYYDIAQERIRNHIVQLSLL